MAIKFIANTENEKSGQCILDDEDVTFKGNIRLDIGNGQTISLAEVLERLETLERLYMEEKLLGKTE